MISKLLSFATQTSSTHFVHPIIHSQQQQQKLQYKQWLCSTLSEYLSIDKTVT